MSVNIIFVVSLVLTNIGIMFYMYNTGRPMLDSALMAWYPTWTAVIVVAMVW